MSKYLSMIGMIMFCSCTLSQTTVHSTGSSKASVKEDQAPTADLEAIVPLK